MPFGSETSKPCSISGKVIMNVISSRNVKSIMDVRFISALGLMVLRWRRDILNFALSRDYVQAGYIGDELVGEVLDLNGCGPHLVADVVVE